MLLSPHLLQFLLPLVCLSICICVSSPSSASASPSSSSPPFSWRRLRNDQSGFDAAGPCPGFPQHMSPGNYKSAPSCLLLLCNAPVWSKRKKKRRTRRSEMKSEKRGDKDGVKEKTEVWGKGKCTTCAIFRCSTPFTEFHSNIWRRLKCAVDVWMLQHTWGRKEVFRHEEGWGCRWGWAGKMMAPLSPVIIRQDWRGSPKSAHHMIHTSCLPRT